MENVYVVFDRDNVIMGIFRTLESAKECALEEIEDYCNRYRCDEFERSDYITALNHNLYVDELVYISLETLYN